MANAPKKKGTNGETELLRLLDIDGLVRTPASSVIDLARPGSSPVEVLATRPDRGRWLMTMTADDFLRLFNCYAAQGEERGYDDGLRIEVKRYARFAHHAIFEEKFRR